MEIKLSPEHLFRCRYAPYENESFRCKPRSMEEIPDFDPKQPYLRSLAFQIDQQRTDDPIIGAKLAADEILSFLFEYMTTDEGILAAPILGICAAHGGMEISRGIIQTVLSMPPFDPEEIGVNVIEEDDGEAYLTGELAAAEVLAFCQTAMPNMPDIEPYLKQTAMQTAAAIGAEAYWDTPYIDEVGKSPVNTVLGIHGRFGLILDVCTRYPQERALAHAYAAKKIIETAESVYDRETLLGILAEYAWKAAHYIWKEE